MGKALVIAEKPSVAADIARVLGKTKKEKDYFESADFVISSAIGHLVELCAPESVEVKRGKWKFENLPVIPDEFDLRPIEKTQARFNLLKRLMKRKDIDTVINACDAGREGELIFRYLMKLAGVDKPVQRLWLQSMTPGAIKAGFANLRTDEEMIPLAQAAASRAEADWLVGINSTRALTAFNSKMGGFQLTPAGRVQTPTLAILVEREEKIRAFKPRPYFEVFADFGVQAGEYRGRWLDEAFKKSDDEDARAERLWDGSRAEAIKAKCVGKTGVVTEEKKPTTQAPPLLYDLTTLQREANGRFGFSAKRTLQLAQQLYERHKVLTYPRTDSRYLAEDQLTQARGVMGSFEDDTLARHAAKALERDWVRPSKRIFNNAKVTDHTAIVPTGESPRGLDEWQQKLFDMVARRFIAVFYPAAQFEVTTRITRVEGEAFRTDGKIVVDPGWLAVYGREAEGKGEDRAIVAVTPGEIAKVLNVETRESMTKPAPRFNEATLLSAMEGAGKLVDDEELREAMSARGLGTPATRASIIEGLIFQDYIGRNGRELVATSRGISLITLLRSIGVGALCLPELTGEWEHKLKQIEQSQLKRRDFMEQIRELTRDAVEKIKQGNEPSAEQFPPVEAKCPKCGHGVFKQDYRTFRCAECDHILWKNMAGREFSPDEVRALFTDKKIGPLDGFRSKMGRSFAASVVLGEDQKPKFEFDNGEAGEGEEIDLTGLPRLGTCPVCKQGQVVEMERAYACENNLSAAKTCTMRMGRTILQREIPREQAVKLIETGKTDLIRGFVSKKGRPFEAYLKLDKGKVGFEFEERKKRQPAKKAAAV